MVSLVDLKQHIHAIEDQHHRDRGAVSLLAVSKNQPLTKIRDLFAQGQRAFAENYLQEALPKITALAAEAITWHFIGHIQRNKTKQIAINFAWVHSIDRCDIAQRLHEQRPSHLPPLQVCIEINNSATTNKAGIPLAQLPSLINCIQALPRLQWRGLMSMITEEYEVVAKTFRTLQLQGYTIDTLSMGMSQDYPQAIASGATLVRIGTALFGERQR